MLRCRKLLLSISPFTNNGKRSALENCKTRPCYWRIFIDGGGDVLAIQGDGIERIELNQCSKELQSSGSLYRQL